MTLASPPRVVPTCWSHSNTWPGSPVLLIIPKSPLSNLQAVHVLEWYTVGTQPKIAWWMTVFEVGLLPSMSHLSHRNDDSIAYTEQTMPKQKGRKTSKSSSLPRHRCLWYCRINEPVVMMVVPHSCEKISTPSQFEAILWDKLQILPFLNHRSSFFWHLKWVNQGNGKC